MVKIGLTYPSADVVQRYRKWWKGKYLKDGRQIIAVHWYGPPSGFYGEVEIELDDGTRQLVQHPYQAYKPRKSDLDVFDKKKNKREGIKGG